MPKSTVQIDVKKNITPDSLLRGTVLYTISQQGPCDRSDTALQPKKTGGPEMAGPNLVSGNLKILILSIVLVILERLLDFVILHPSLVYPMMESYIEQFVLKPNGLEKVKFPSF